MDKRKKKNHGAEDDINAFESEDYSMEHYSKTGSLSNNFNANEIELDFTSLDGI